MVGVGQQRNLLEFSCGNIDFDQQHVFKMKSSECLLMADLSCIDLRVPCSIMEILQLAQAASFSPLRHEDATVASFLALRTPINYPA